MGGRFPIGYVGMLLVVERATAAYDRQVKEVVNPGWGVCIPLESKGIPRIGAGLLTRAQADDDIPEEYHDSDADGESAEGGKEVHFIPTEIAGIGVDAARHTEQPQDVHGEEGEVEADQHQPELDLSQAFAEQLAGYLGEPVVDARENAQDGAAEEHVMQVRDHEVGIRELVVNRHYGQSYTIEAADQEHGDEAKRKEHGHLEADLAAIDCRDPVEDLHGRRDGDERGAGSEEGLSDEWEANGKHVVRPHCKAQEANGDARPGDEGIAEDGLAREDGQYLRDNAKGGEDEDIHLGMTKRPEEVLPEQGIAMEAGLIEVGTQVTVEQQQASGSGNAGQGKEQQERGYQGHPREQRYAVHGHARGAQPEDGYHEVESAGDRGDAEQENAERPEVGVHGREAVCNATAILLFAQWRVVEPAAIGSLVEQEAGIQENCGKENEPVPEGVQAWEGHITGADHEGYNVVAEASKHGHHK